MKAVRLEAGKYAEIVDIEGGLKSLQNAVGGLIEVVYPFRRRALKLSNGKIYDAIAGTALILGDTGEGEFCGLSDRDAEHYLKMFYAPEAFIMMNGEVRAIPCTPRNYRIIMHVED